VMAASCEFSRERFADALRGAGHDGATVCGGEGEWHAAHRR
jgi:hypothetical protein